MDLSSLIQSQNHEITHPSTFNTYCLKIKSSLGNEVQSKKSLEQIANKKLEEIFLLFTFEVCKDEFSLFFNDLAEKRNIIPAGEFFIIKTIQPIWYWKLEMQGLVQNYYLTLSIDLFFWQLNLQAKVCDHLLIVFVIL